MGGISKGGDGFVEVIGYYKVKSDRISEVLIIWFVLEVFVS